MWKLEKKWIHTSLELRPSTFDVLFQLLLVLVLSCASVDDKKAEKAMCIQE
jgi:hypothetical protein